VTSPTRDPPKPAQATVSSPPSPARSASNPGSFRFDANGDTTQALASVFRIKRGQVRLLTVITAPTSANRSSG